MSAYPSTTLRAAKATFLREVASMPESRLVNLLAERETSDGPSEDYVWVGEAPRMQELEDELRTEALSDATYSIVNKTYKIGIDIRRQDMEDDRVGGIMRRVRGLARVATRHSERLIISGLEAATTDTGYDGSAFFANAHADRGAGTQDNLLGGSGATTANIQTDLNTGIQTLAGFLGENGEPVNEDGFGRILVVAPFGLRKSVLEALNASIISNTSNVGFSDQNIIPYFSARLSDADDWYMLHLDGPVKPIIYQERTPLTTEELGEGSDQWTLKEIATFAARWRGRVGYGHWAHAIKFVN